MKRQRGGFMIIQMLVVLGFMAAFVVVAERLFRLTIQTTTHTVQAQEDLIRLEQAMHALREDVWSAAKVDAPDRSTLTLQSGDEHGSEIEWKTGADGQLIRKQKNEDNRAFRDLQLEFARQGPWVVVSRHGSEIALLRLRRSAGGAK